MSLAKKPSAALSHEQGIGVKWKVQRGWRSSQARNLILLVRRVVVEDDVDILVRRGLALDAVEEADELLMAVPLHVLHDARSVQHIESGEERRGAVPFVVMGHRAGAALLHRQAGLGSVERLDLRLLVDRQHHRMGRRVNIEADDIRELLGKSPVVRELEVSPAVWAEAVRLPDRLVPSTPQRRPSSPSRAASSGSPRAAVA